MNDQIIWNHVKIRTHFRKKHLWYKWLIANQYPASSWSDDFDISSYINFSNDCPEKLKNLFPKNIVIGNLTTGGSGKTELCLFLSRLLNEENRIVVKQLDPLRDERNYVLSEGRLAEGIEDCAYSAIYDDGLHSRNLKRDLNILCLRGDLPVGNGKIFPFGPLRPRFNFPDIHLICITHCGIKAPSWATKIPSERLMLLRYKLKRKDEDFIKSLNNSQRVIVFCAIADHRRLTNLILNSSENLNFSVVAFPDHHRFVKADWKFIEETAKKEGANHFFTTAKDWHRENFQTMPELIREKLKVLMLEHEVDNDSLRNLAAYLDVK